ncbi:acyl-CoA dehydrogenase family protein [Shewanella surugensis]|uniref:Acyl-CoA dehydrogenase family protein n=1 Tax=Shewanella surugensis TaxID=212020 RepID=A0ABT0LDV9_9GAMM|nr:acyl-CoA dehydrogenase family protein [Shewanella surugensis]MCL1125685.1 acyl-CoA dehydrogenase family protein [Shewanella surugensis]
MSQNTTHTVFNQAPSLTPYNAFLTDPLLQQQLNHYQSDWGFKQLQEYGSLVGGQMFEWGFEANRYIPELRNFDRFGHRIDEVYYHPAYHHIMEQALKYRLHNLPWTEPRKGAHNMRAALFYLHAQAEAGTACPITMTFASAAALANIKLPDPQWYTKLLSNQYDPSTLPLAQKKGITIGMAMTEKQGGSDVKSNTSIAKRHYTKNASYHITGHKWFCSAPMSDAFLVLANLDQGLSCFLLPRWLDNKQRNSFQIQRLKDKLGNRSNASSEVEFDHSQAYLLSKPGQGIKTIMKMVSLTRFDCILGSAALMRQSLVQAYHHCQHRSIKQRYLIDQPIMRNVLADMALDSNAALLVGMRLAKCLDDPQDKTEQQLFHIGCCLGKYWICKRASLLVTEAAECLGGGGYIEESILPRLYREAPVNSLWEGSANVQCLDLLRILLKEPDVIQAFLCYLNQSKGKLTLFDTYLSTIEKQIIQIQLDPVSLSSYSRILANKLALAWQAALMLMHQPEAIARQFCQNRLTGEFQGVYGGLTDKVAITDILNDILH